jgi:hypothetical protein
MRGQASNSRGSGPILSTQLVVVAFKSRLVPDNLEPALLENASRSLVLRLREGTYLPKTKVSEPVPQRKPHDFGRESSTLAGWVDEVAYLGSPSRCVRIYIQASPSDHTLLQSMYDSPRSEAIYAPSIRVSTKPNLTRSTRLRPEREPHVIPIALNLVQRIDIWLSELPENQVIGVQLRHERLNLSQVWAVSHFEFKTETPPKGGEGFRRP